MKCMFCGSDPDAVVLLNLAQKEGSLFRSPFSCIPCARGRGLYCDRHQIGHSEYPPDGTTCSGCVSDMMDRNLRRGPDFLKRIYQALPTKVSAELNDYFDFDPDEPNFGWRARRLVKELSLRACCRRVPLRTIVDEICRTKSIRPIFP